MISRAREMLYRAMVSPRGDSFRPLRIGRDLTRRLNETLGRPLAPGKEVATRQEARARLAALRASGATGRRAPREPAPVIVYFEKDRNARALARIEELLASKGITWKRLDVSGDEPTLDFVTLRARCDRDDLPVVFVADRAMGGYEALVRADVSGELSDLAG